MPLHIHDTLRREKRLFEPRNKDRVTLYVCGPTVYDYAHIGNARPPVVFDVLARLLRREYGADKVIYAGYFPMGLSLERIMSDMENVPLKDEVWPKFLRGNAERLFKL